MNFFFLLEQTLDVNRLIRGGYLKDILYPFHQNELVCQNTTKTIAQILTDFDEKKVSRKI